MCVQRQKREHLRRSAQRFPFRPSRNVAPRLPLCYTIYIQEGGISTELRVLNYFLMAAREENITRAAELLHVTQPTLSRQIAQLEEELGVKLFQRSNHHIILTDDGMLLKRRAQELVSLAEKTKRDFSHRGEISGVVSIGSGELKSMQFLSEAIASFREKYPGVTFEIYSGDSDDIKERIDRGLLDIGLLLEPVDISKYDFVRTNITEEWYALVSTHSPLAEKAVLTPADFENVPLIFTRRELAQAHIFSWLGKYANENNIAASGNLLHNIAILARNGVGCVISIRLDPQYEGLKYIPLSPKLESGTVLVWKKMQPFPRATETFIEHLKEMFKQHF